MIKPDDYEIILSENPELHVHPLRLKPSRCENSNIKMEEEPIASQPVE